MIHPALPSSPPHWTSFQLNPHLLSKDFLIPSQKTLLNVSLFPATQHSNAQRRRHPSHVWCSISTTLSWPAFMVYQHLPVPFNPSLNHSSSFASLGSGSWWIKASPGVVWSGRRCPYTGATAINLGQQPSLLLLPLFFYFFIIDKV